MQTGWQRATQFWLCCCAAWALWPNRAITAADAPQSAASTTANARRASTIAAAPSQAAQITADIDRLLADSWQQADVQPAAPAGDAEFLRRVHLDLAGKIPTVAEVRQFLADTRPDKRERLVDEQLEGAIFAAHFANIWREMLLAGTNPELRTGSAELESWLRLRFAAGTPYNQLVAELVASATAATAIRPAQAVPSLAVTVPSPAAFFQANERKPENLAASLSKVFLGVDVQCAQCHDHPFAHWKQGDFWSLAAFFRGMDSSGSGMTMTVSLVDSRDRTGLPIPGTESIALPRFLDHSSPDWQTNRGNRAVLADWMTRADNPFFGRAAVNRVWSVFFGRALAPPADSGTTSPAAHVRLLDALAEKLVSTGFDLKQLIRGIVLSRAYQTSSRGDAENDARTALFAAMPVRRMTGDQLFDSLMQATGFYEPPPPRTPGLQAVPSVRADFRAKFAEDGQERGDSQTSIVQALTLLNGKLVGDATSVEASRTLQAVLKMPRAQTADRLECLFLATVSRPPSEAEAKRFLDFVAGGETDARLADVFWVLLNSAEFASNH